MKKLVLLGPVYPYKGGISHYTGLLYRALAKTCDVTMVSYRMQYPKFLFKKEQKDYSNDRFQIPDTKYWLNTANPFNIAATAHKINRLHPDLVLIQWWHPYFAPCYYILTKLLRRTRIAFVCHNVFPHERFPMDRFLTRLVLKQGDHFIVHSVSDGKELTSIRPDADLRVAFHPTYNVFKISDLTKAEARKRLGLNEKTPVLLFFGFVRPYKGLRYLLDAMALVRREIADVTLLVVGEFGPDRAQYEEQIDSLKIRDCLRLYDGYIPDSEVENYFAACDLVVLPYVSATQSGIVQIAYGFEKPVAATAVGGLPDVVREGETGCLAAPKDAASLAGAICRFFENAGTVDYEKHIREQADRYSWDRMREVVESFLIRTDRR